MPGYLRLKVRELLREHETNLHQAMLAGGFSYPTMHRYMNRPDQSESLHSPSIVALLVTALGYAPAEIEARPFGHFFEVVVDGERQPFDEAELVGWLLDSYLPVIRRLGDPVLANLYQDVQDRLEHLSRLRDEEDPLGTAEEQAYLARLLIDRLAFWDRHGPAKITRDPRVAEAVQAAFVELSRLLLEAEEQIDPGDGSTTGPAPENLVEDRKN